MPWRTNKMPTETRSKRQYVYRLGRRAGKTVRLYVGPATTPQAVEAQQAEDRRRQETQARSERRRREREAFARLTLLPTMLALLADRSFREEMEALGFRLHRRSAWRLRKNSGA